MKTTIRDIAKKLNLSIAAVSRAMDGYPDISEETRRRVIETAREMGYVPNQAARQLRRRKAEAIGYILPASTPRFSDPFFSEFIAGLGDETACHPFDLMISLASPGEEAEQHIYQKWVQTRKVDGFILNRMRLHDWRAQFLSQQGICFTALENTLDGLDFPHVEIDNEGGEMALVRHVIERGFHRVAFIGGPSELKNQAARYEGYRHGLAEADLPYDPALVLESDMTSSGGYQSARHLLALPDPPEAILCINDETAFGVLHAAHERGLAVGRNPAVAGFDGVQASKHTEPPLTTMDIPVYEIGRRLVKMLVAILTDQPLPERKIIIQPELLIRRSTEGLTR